jgi:hypothetical protein
MAEDANAAELAPTLLAKARRAESEARGAVEKGDHAKALKSLVLAEITYNDALTQAWRSAQRQWIERERRRHEAEQPSR